MEEVRVTAYAIILVAFILASAPGISATALRGLGGGAQGKARWTILVYIAGDNDLEPAALKDLAELEVHGSSSSINVVVLMDRSDRPYEERYNTEFARAMGDWSDARIFYVEKDGYTLSYSSKMIEELGEVDTGDPRILAGFISKYASRYPAEHYALIVWDHGAGFGGVAFDYDARDYLTPKEVAEAIRSSGIHLDLIAFDACLMGSYEVVYELRDLADYVVASEETVPNDGYPYDHILGKLHKNPGMSAGELGRVIVEAYRDFYSETEPTATLSLISLEVLRGSVDAAKAFAHAAALHPEDLRNAREGVEEFGGGGDPSQGASNVDLLMLLEKLSQRGGEISGAAREFLDKLQRAVVTHWEGEKHSGARGLTIYFPLRYDAEGYRGHSSFADETEWSRALERAVNVEANIEDAGEAYQAYQATATEIASGTANLTGKNLYVRIVGMGASDLDGDGDDEIVVITMVLDFDAGYSWIILNIFDMANGEMLRVYGRAVAGAEYTLFSMAGGTDLDSDGDGAWEIYFGINALDYSGDYIQAYSWLYKVAWRDNNYTVLGLKLDNVILKGVEHGRVLSGDEIDIVAGGLRLKDDGSLRSFIQVFDPAGLRSRLVVEASNPSLFMAGLDVGNLTGGAKDLVVAGMNIIEGAGDTATLRGSEVDLLEVSPSGISPVGSAGKDNAGIATIDIADLDGDGLDEAVVLTKKNIEDKGELAIFKYSDGRLQAVKTMDLENLDYVGMAAEVYDVDGDGIKEVLLLTGEVIDAEDGYVEARTIEVYAWMPSSGSLVFESKIMLSEDKATYPLTADLNGDSKPDLVYVQRTNTTISVLIANISNYVDPTGIIKGAVVDYEGNPAPGAVVRVFVSKQSEDVANTTTDEQGRFEVRVPAGSYYVEATLRDRSSMRIPVRVEAGGEAEATLDFRNRQEQPNPWLVISTTTTTTTTITTTTTTTSTTTTTTITTTTTSLKPPTTTQTGTSQTTTTTTKPTSTTQTTQASTTESIPLPMVSPTTTTTPAPSTTGIPSPSATTSSGEGVSSHSTQSSSSPRAGGDTMYKAAIIILVIVAAALWLRNKRSAAALILLVALQAASIPALVPAATQEAAPRPWWIYRGLRVSYVFFSGSSVTSPWKDWRASLAEISVPLAELKVTIPKPGSASMIGGVEKYVVTEVEADRIVSRDVIWMGGDTLLQQSYDVEARPFHSLFNGPFWIDARLVADVRVGQTVPIPGDNGDVPYTVTFVGRVDISYEASITGREDSIAKVTGFISELPVPLGTYRDIVVLVGEPPINQQHYQQQGQPPPRNARHVMVVDKELGLILYESYGELSGGTTGPGGQLTPLRNSLYVREISEVTLDLEDQLPPYTRFNYGPLLQPGYDVIYIGFYMSVLGQNSMVRLEYMLRGMYKNKATVMETIIYGTEGPMPLTLARDWLVNLDTGEAVLMKSINPLTNQELKQEEGRRVKATFLWIDGHAGEDVVEIQGVRYRKAGEDVVDASSQGLPQLGKLKVYTYVLEGQPSSQGLSYTKLHYTEDGMLLALKVYDRGQPLQQESIQGSLKLIASTPYIRIESTPQHPPAPQQTTPGTSTTTSTQTGTSSQHTTTPPHTSTPSHTAITQGGSQPRTTTVTKTVTKTVSVKEERNSGSSSYTLYKAIILVLLAFIAFQVYKILKRRTP